MKLERRQKYAQSAVRGAQNRLNRRRGRRRERLVKVAFKRAILYNRTKSIPF